MEIAVKRFDKSIPLPAYDHGAACFDLRARETTSIPPGEIVAVPQNIAVRVPHGYVFLLFLRSSMPLKRGIVLANGVGVVDPFYCGNKDEIVGIFHNITAKTITIEKGEQIAQGMIVKAPGVSLREVEDMGSSGHGGYSVEK